MSARALARQQLQSQNCIRVQVSVIRLQNSQTNAKGAQSHIHEGREEEKECTQTDKHIGSQLAHTLTQNLCI